MKAKPTFPVRDLLPHGKDNSITPKALCRAAGYDDERTLRKEIEIERCDGAVILSDVHGGGYYLPDKPSEIAEWVAGREQSIRTTRKSIKAAKKILKSWRQNER